MRTLFMLSAVLVMAFAVGCSDAAAPTPNPTDTPTSTESAPPQSSSAPTVEPKPSPTSPARPAPQATPDAPEDMMGLQDLEQVPAGRYFIDPDGDPETTLRVTYELPAGWSNWIGAAKFSDAGNVGVSISTISNLVTDGCDDHAWAHPPVGPTVDDLAVALTELPPFEVTSAPEDVSRYGYAGKHLAWKVPEIPALGETLADCEGGKLMSWVAFIDTTDRDGFYGYTGPGYVEEFWILDVEGTRLMIAAEQSAGSPAEDIAERDAILESIVIEP